MAKADLAELETALLKKIMGGADEFRRNYSNYHMMLIHNNTIAIKKEALIQMRKREGYDSNKAFKKGLQVRLGEKEGAKQYKAIRKIIKKGVPEFNERVFDAVDAEFKKENSKWEIKWIRRWPKWNHKFTIRKVKTKGKGSEVFQAYKGVFKAKQQRPLINAINAWSMHPTKVEGVQGYEEKRTNSRRGQHFEDPELNRKIGSKTGLKGKEASRTIRTKGSQGLETETWKTQSTGKHIGEEIDSDSNDPFLDLGHQGQGVGGQRKLVARDFVATWPMESGSDVSKAVSDALTIKLNSSNKYKGNLQKFLTCSWESSSMNKATRSAMKNEVDNLKEELQKIIIQLGKEMDGWENAEASDSMTTMIEKTVVNGLVSPLKRSKGVRAKTRLKVKNRKNSKSAHKGKTVKPRRTASAPKHNPVKLAAVMQATRSPKKNKSKRGPANSPLFLLGIFNKQLPETVKANMGDPALTNVTGRFASSVRTTDMVTTAQGHPSFGYTYQRDPYGTFEQDTDYDPRKLIDRSMREIAAEYAIGRFYTRRV